MACYAAWTVPVFRPRLCVDAHAPKAKPAVANIATNHAEALSGTHTPTTGEWFVFTSGPCLRRSGLNQIGLRRRNWLGQ